MSLFALAGPAQVALPVLRSAGFIALGTLRSLLTVGILFAIALFFKPMIVGVAQAIVLLVKPRVSYAVRRDIHRIRGIKLLNRMARDMESSQPNVAAELRSFAARD